MGNVYNGLYRPYVPPHRAITCLEIIQSDQRIKITCQTFYVEGVARTEKSRYPASRLLYSPCKKIFVCHTEISVGYASNKIIAYWTYNLHNLPEQDNFVLNGGLIVFLHMLSYIRCFKLMYLFLSRVLP